MMTLSILCLYDRYLLLHYWNYVSVLSLACFSAHTRYFITYIGRISCDLLGGEVFLDRVLETYEFSIRYL